MCRNTMAVGFCRFRNGTKLEVTRILMGFALIWFGWALRVDAQDVILAYPVEGITLDEDLSDWPTEMRQYELLVRDGKLKG